MAATQRLTELDELVSRAEYAASIPANLAELLAEEIESRREVE